MSLEKAVSAVGHDAHPTGHLRAIQQRTPPFAWTLQQEWRGEFGKIWLGVPVTLVDDIGAVVRGDVQP